MRPLLPLLLALAVLALSPFIVEAMGMGYLLGPLTRIAIYAMAASALNLVLGYGAMVSFGHAAYLGIGAYVTAILSFHAFEETGLLATNAALWAWPAAMAAAGLGALLIGLISLRTSGVYFIMITLAFAQMFYFFFVSLEGYGGDDGLAIWWGRNEMPLLDLHDRLTFFYVCFALLAFWLLLMGRLVASPFGRALMASRQNEPRLAALGIAPFPVKLAAFTLSGTVCGLAGALLTNMNEFVSPSVLHWSRSGELMIMVILGGLGTLAGPLLGAAALILLEELLIGYTEHWQLFLGVILLAVVLLSRGGLASLLAARGGHG